jgi:DNA-binding response OmpR family regulator
MRRILIIEDHADIRRLLRWALEPDGHDVIEATNGQAGLDQMQATEPDLVLLDVMMPGELDGFQVCERIRSQPKFQRIPIVMVSARSSDSDRRASTRAGADAYITKPFSPMTVSRAVEKLLSERRLAPTAVTPRRRDPADGPAVEPGPSGTSQPPQAAGGADSQLIHCIYTSEANQAFDAPSLTSLLQSVRVKNEQLGLSGMLLMAGTDFFQVLEGPRHVVDATFARIESDPRHKRVTKIVRESIPHRFFKDWTMGFSKVSHEDLATMLGRNDFFNEGRCLAELDPGRARQLLGAFREGRWRQSLAGQREAARM